jgi:hypothetical protein
VFDLAVFCWEMDVRCSNHSRSALVAPACA